NHASTQRGPAWVGGVHGAALRLNGNRQQASSPDSPSLNPGAAITLAAWVKPEKATGTQYIIKKMELGSVDGYELTLLDGGTVLFRFNRETPGSSCSLNSQDSYPSDGNTWAHIAATYDGATMRMYI